MRALRARRARRRARLGGLSGGERRRLGVALAFAGRSAAASSSTSRRPDSTATRGWPSGRPSARTSRRAARSSSPRTISRRPRRSPNGVVLIEGGAIVADGPVAELKAAAGLTRRPVPGRRPALDVEGAERDGDSSAAPHPRRRGDGRAARPGAGCPLVEPRGAAAHARGGARRSRSRAVRLVARPRPGDDGRARSAIPAYVVPDAAPADGLLPLLRLAGPARRRDGADGDVRRVRGDRGRVLPVRRRDRRRPRLAVGGVSADAAGRPGGRGSRARLALGRRVRRARPPRCSSSRRVAVERRVAQPAAAGRRSRSRCSPAPCRSRSSGSRSATGRPRKAALPIANLLYLVLAYAGGLWTRPSALPARRRGGVSRFLPTRALSDGLVAAALAARRSPGAPGLRSSLFTALFAAARGRRLPPRRRAAILVTAAATSCRRCCRKLRPPLKLWWELVIVLVVLKIPVFYVGWVIWWAIKAEPELGTEGGTEGVNWTPWRRPPRERLARTVRAAAAIARARPARALAPRRRREARRRVTRLRRCRQRVTGRGHAPPRAASSLGARSRRSSSSSTSRSPSRCRRCIVTMVGDHDQRQVPPPRL